MTLPEARSEMSTSIVTANLFYRPMRTLATILAIALEVVLILIVVGLTRGMVNEQARRMEGLGADIVLQPPGSSFLLATSTAAMSEKIADLLKEVDGVAAAAPVMVQLNTQGGLGLLYAASISLVAAAFRNRTKSSLMTSRLIRRNFKSEARSAC